MRQRRSQELLARARRVIPGGVNSPVRAFGGAQVSPPFIKRGEGAWLFDEDGNRFVDYVGSWGPMILGHAHPRVVEALDAAIRDGTSYGAPTHREVELAERLVKLIPSVESVRLVNSGTEATMSALRLARAATGRDKVIKFVGCYHGHADPFLIQAGSGLATHGVPSSPGVPAPAAADTLSATYNDLDGVEALLAANPGQVAAVIVEPVAGNMGCVLPRDGFLAGLRDACTKHGTLLIFDEVMTGFRVGPTGAQGHFGIDPDLTTLGKVIGGGLPVGAYGGRRDLMEQISPAGPVYQAGTLSGNPLAVAAGLATLDLLFENPRQFDRLAESTSRLATGLETLAADLDLDLHVPHVGSMGCIYFRRDPVHDFEDAQAADAERFYRFHASMLSHGVYLAPSPFEAFFVSLAHQDSELDVTLAAARQSLAEVVAS